MLVQLMEAKVSYVKINERGKQTLSKKLCPLQWLIGESNELLNLTMWIL